MQGSPYIYPDAAMYYTDPLLYVADSGLDEIHVYKPGQLPRDHANLQYVYSIPLESRDPLSVAPTPDGQYLFIGSLNEISYEDYGRVDRFHLPSNFIWSLWYNENPTRLIVNSSGTAVYSISYQYDTCLKSDISGFHTNPRAKWKLDFLDNIPLNKRNKHLFPGANAITQGPGFVDAITDTMLDIDYILEPSPTGIVIGDDSFSAVSVCQSLTQQKRKEGDSYGNSVSLLARLSSVFL